MVYPTRARLASASGTPRGRHPCSAWVQVEHSRAAWTKVPRKRPIEGFLCEWSRGLGYTRWAGAAALHHALVPPRPAHAQPEFLYAIRCRAGIVEGLRSENYS